MSSGNAMSYGRKAFNWFACRAHMNGEEGEQTQGK